MGLSHPLPTGPGPRSSGADPRRSLRSLTEALLDEGADAGSVDAAARDLHGLLARLAGLGEEGEWTRERALPSGRALSPLDAARCARDGSRTAAFLRGGDAALTALLERTPGRAVEVLYAGTGPLAPLVLPLLALREKGSVLVTFLDVHPAAAGSVARLIDALSLGGFVRDVATADAAAWAPPHGTGLDLLVVEAMERSLAREPQAAICRHLVPRLAPSGCLLPEEVAVDLVLTDPDVERSAGADSRARAQARVAVGRVLELTRERAVAPPGPSGAFPEVSVVLPEGIGPRRRAALLTSVRVFGPHAVAEGASGLTTPEILWGVPLLPAGARLSFRYREGRVPGLVWRVS